MELSEHKIKTQTVSINFFVKLFDNSVTKNITTTKKHN